ncbi:MAG: hypothetical protein KJZ78_13515, partial [Bryobacteraceae bacterium]|nr:hypothetical protein [Bryobacteraceae bacterium]
SVAYATADGTAQAGLDYIATSGTLVFAPGETTKTIRVPVLGDTTEEADERFYLNLSSPNGATLADGTGECLIRDDDATWLSVTESWAIVLDSSTSANVNYGDIAFDSAGNVYLTGSFSGTMDFDPAEGEAKLISEGSSGFVAKYSSGGHFCWARDLGRGAYGLDVDDSGQIYVGGHFDGTAVFGGKPTDATTILTSRGDYDAFLAKLDSSGRFAWARQFGGTGADRAWRLAVDNSQHAYLVGFFNGVALADGVQFTSQGGQDIFVVQFDAVTGAAITGQRMGGTSEHDMGIGVAVDRQNGVYVTGRFGGTADFGATTLVSRGSTDLFVAKLGTLCEVQWATQAGADADTGRYERGGPGIAVDDRASDATQWGLYISGVITSATTGDDAFVARFEASSGRLVWSRQIGSGRQDWFDELSLDSAGDLYVSGRFSDIVDVDCGSGERLVTSLSPHYENGLVLKLSSQGEYQSAWQARGYERVNCSVACVDLQGMLYVIGTASENANFETGIQLPPDESVLSAYRADIFLLKFDPGLTLVRGKVFLDSDRGGIRGIEPDLPEPGLPHWIVFADQNGNGRLDSWEPSTETSADGSYSLNLGPGSHSIRLESQPGWELITPTQGELSVTVGGDDPSLPIVGGDFGLWRPHSARTYVSTDTPQTIPNGRFYSTVTTSTIHVPGTEALLDLNLILNLHNPLGSTQLSL